MNSRIVSLLPSSTEIVCALGCSEKLVGRSHECDFPATVQALPACTRARINPEAASREIDAAVKTQLQNALSIYDVDVEQLKELRPDIILTQAQCEVCAVSLSDVELALADWTGTRPAVMSLSPTRLEDVWSDIQKVAEALGISERGKRLVEVLNGRIAQMAAVAGRSERHPSVACIEWIEPLMAAGNWVPELVEFAGGRNLFGITGQHSSWLEWEDLVAADPDIIVIMPCGFDLDRAWRESKALACRHEWDTLRAVRQGHVYVTDGNQYFNRPGPRLADSLEILAEITHPELFSSRYEGHGWRRL